MIHTKESCFAAAAAFTSKADLKSGASPEYQWLCRNGFLDEACKHIAPLRRSFTDSGIAEIALKYDGRRQFKLADQSAYNTAKKRGILDLVCGHMAVKYRNLTDEDIRVLALKYSTRSEFSSSDTGAYQASIKRGLLESVCAHMDGKGTRRLTDAEILAIASQFTTRNDFKLFDFGAYTTAIRRDLITEACAHMEPGSTGFREDKPAFLYQFRIELPGGLVVYKSGITNRKPRQRMFTMGIVRGYKAELTHAIHFDSGRDARIAEKLLHRRFSSHKYVGPRVMKNGNTELFTVSVLVD